MDSFMGQIMKAER